MSGSPKVYRKLWADLSEESDDDLGPWSSTRTNTSTTITEYDKHKNVIEARKSSADLWEESGDDFDPWSSTTSNASTTIAEYDDSLNEVPDQMVIDVVQDAISTPKDLTWVTQELKRLAPFSEHVKDVLTWHAWNEDRMQFLKGEKVDLAALLSNLQNPGVDEFEEHFRKTFGKTKKSNNYMSLLLAMKSLARSLILMIYFSRQLVQLEKRLDGCFDSSKISELIIKPTDIIIELIEPTERMGRRFIDCLKGSQFLSLDQNSIQVFRETFRNWMLEWKTIFRRWKDILHEISASETFPQTFQDLAYESEESLVCCDKKVQHLCYCIESIVEC